MSRGHIPDQDTGGGHSRSDPPDLLLRGDHKGDQIGLSHIPGLKLTAKWQRPMGRRGKSLPLSLGE